MSSLRPFKIYVTLKIIIGFMVNFKMIQRRHNSIVILKSTSLLEWYKEDMRVIHLALLGLKHLNLTNLEGEIIVFMCPKVSSVELE